jgi:hypothetical protein
LLSAYLYSRAQSVMGGTSQIQKNIIAARILGLGAAVVHDRRLSRDRRQAPRREDVMTAPG